MYDSKQHELFQPRADQTELTGTIERITFQNKENDYVVVRFRLENSGRNLITVVGQLPSVVEGERLRVQGEWQKHNRFGFQFQVKKFITLHPLSKRGIELYLGSGLIQGIGPVYAKKIVHAFGLDTIEVLDKNPERLLEVEGIGEKRLEMIRRGWNAHHVVREIMVFLAEHGVSSTYAMKIFKEYGTQTLNILNTNPYQLADDIHGIGFLTADKIAKNIGVSEEEPARIEAGIKYVLSQGMDRGHLYLPEEELIQTSSELLKVSSHLIRRICSELCKVNHLVNDEGCIYLSGMFQAETDLARRLLRLKQSPFARFPLDTVKKEVQRLHQLQGIEYNRRQHQALLQAVMEKILIITGGPGTGKTTIIKGIIQLFEFLGLRVLLAAPTGRAAKRLAETSRRKAQTIHRLLEFEPQKHAFQRNQKRPLHTDVIIVDEMSMVDCLLAHHLLKAVPLHARLIMVGDVDQLPSVGAGNVLRDLIDSNTLCTVHLNEIFRQAIDSQIIVNAHQINRGLMPDLSRRTAPERATVNFSSRLTPRQDFGDFLFVQEENPGKIVNLIQELCLTKLPQRYGYQAKQDIQILTPMYRGELGADNLNAVLQNILNPEKRHLKRGKNEFRVGDRVMQIRNNYEKKVFNGDLGFIHSIDQEDQKVLVQFEKMIAYEWSELDELVLAYAITVHKSQGSEYPVVIMPITTQHYVMLQRNLLYTAVTRAKELIILIGTQKALALAIKNNRVLQRNTRLAQRLQDSLSSSEENFPRNQGEPVNTP